MSEQDEHADTRRSAPVKDSSSSTKKKKTKTLMEIDLPDAPIDGELQLQWVGLESQTKTSFNNAIM